MEKYLMFLVDTISVCYFLRQSFQRKKVRGAIPTNYKCLDKFRKYSLETSYKSYIVLRLAYEIFFITVFKIYELT